MPTLETGAAVAGFVAALPTPPAGDAGAGIVQLLAALVPIAAVILLLCCFPGARELFADRTKHVREYLYGPTTALAELDADTAGDAEDGSVPITSTPVPDWFDESIYLDDDIDDDLDDDGTAT